MLLAGGQIVRDDHSNTRNQLGSDEGNQPAPDHSRAYSAPTGVLRAYERITAAINELRWKPGD
ncbi:hypothetical protein D3C73_1545330 [compost metagenome]